MEATADKPKRRYNPKSLENLRIMQQRRKAPPAPAEAVAIGVQSVESDGIGRVIGGPITETRSAPLNPANSLQHQTVATVGLTACAPEMAGIVVKLARDKRTPAAVRLQAACKVLEVAGVIKAPGQQSAQQAVDGLGIQSGDVAAFIQAGQRAIALRQAAQGADDAVIVSDSGQGDSVTR